MEEFLRKHGLELTIEKARRQSPPPWDPPYGLRYKITFRRRTGEELKLDCWGCYIDKIAGREPSVRDVLECIACDLPMPEDPDELGREFGMKPSHAYAAARVIRSEHRFFTPEEKEELMELVYDND
jgi:hypothetical protein